MKSVFIFFAVLLLLVGSAPSVEAVTCGEPSKTFTIDSEEVPVHPDSGKPCTEFLGSLFIKNGSVGSKHLRFIKEVHSNVVFSKPNNIRTEVDIPNLEKVSGYLSVEDQSQVTKIGFNKLTYIHETLTISNLMALTSFTGFKKLKDVGAIYILLLDLPELPRSLFSLVQATCQVNLAGLTGVDMKIKLLKKLKEIKPTLGVTDCWIRLFNNQGIVEIDTFDNLESVTNAYFRFENMPKLKKMAKFKKLRVAGDGGEYGLSLVDLGLETFDHFPKLQTVNGVFTFHSWPNLKTISSAFSALQETSNDLLSMNDFPELTTITSSFKSLKESLYLEIKNNPKLKSIDGFDGLLTVTTGILIQNNALLTSIDGFSRLNRAGYIEISNNGALISVKGFPRLTELTYDTSAEYEYFGLKIKDNALLETVDAFRRLSSVTLGIVDALGDVTAPTDLFDKMNGVVFENLPACVSIRGFEKLKTVVDGSVTIRIMAAVREIPEFKGLLSLGYRVFLSELNVLEQVPKFPKLQSVPEFLLVGSSNSVVQSIDTAPKLTSVEHLLLLGWPALAELAIAPEATTFSLTINGNSITSLPPFKVKVANLSIVNNAQLSDICGLFYFESTTGSINIQVNGLADIKDEATLLAELAKCPVPNCGCDSQLTKPDCKGVLPKKTCKWKKGKCGVGKKCKA